MGSTKDELKQRELFIIKKLRKGYSPTYVISKVVEEFGIAETTATSAVYKINAELNKTNTELMQDAKNYIITTLIGAIEECNDMNDVRNECEIIKTKLQAVKQLSDVCKITETTNNNVDINFKFDV